MNRRRRAEYSEALASLKGWAGQARPEDWTDEEWWSILRQAAAQKPNGVSPDRSRMLFLRPLASAAASLAVLIWAVSFLSQPSPQTGPALRRQESREIVAAAPPAASVPETASVRTAAPIPAYRTLLASAAGAPRPAADKPAFTWISPDTGLQIVWFTNNNLNLEDHQ